MRFSQGKPLSLGKLQGSPNSAGLSRAGGGVWSLGGTELRAFWLQLCLLLPWEYLSLASVSSLGGSP